MLFYFKTLIFWFLWLLINFFIIVLYKLSCFSDDDSVDAVIRSRVCLIVSSQSDVNPLR